MMTGISSGNKSSSCETRGSKATYGLWTRLLAFVLCLSLYYSAVAVTVPAYAEELDGASPITVYLTSKWMQYLPNDMQISQINMPGTHDSGCAKVDPQTWMKWAFAGACLVFPPLQVWLLFHSLKDAAFWLGGTQQWSIKNQMNNGMRVFDIRLRLPSNSNADDLDMRLCHDNKLNCLDVDGSGDLTLRKCINYAKQFLKDNPSETVIFYMDADFPDEKPQTREKIVKILERYKDPEKDPQVIAYRADKKNPTDVPMLGDVRGKVVLVMKYGDGDNALTTYEMHYSYYGSEFTYPEKKADIIKGILQDAQDYNWRQDYFSAKAKKDYWGSENYSYPDKKGELSTPKLIGTNITPLGGSDLDIFTAVFKMIFSDYDLKSLAQKVWNALDTGSVQVPRGYKYGWITMDFPDTTFTKKIIESNFAIPAYEYNITIKNFPSAAAGQQLAASGLKLKNVHEKIEPLEYDLAANECTGQLTIHTENEMLDFTNIPSSSMINLDGKDYYLVRTNQSYVDTRHGEREGFFNKVYPGKYGILNETYTIMKEIPLMKVNAPIIHWIKDKNANVRPADMKAFAREIGTLTWRRTTEDGTSELYALSNTDKNAGPYLTDYTVYVGNEEHTYWQSMSAYVPMSDEKGQPYTYEFMGLTNEVSDSRYDWELAYGPGRQEFLNMTLVSPYGTAEGPQFTFVDRGWSHDAAISDLLQQGIGHTAYNPSGSIAFTEDLDQSKIKVSAASNVTYNTQVDIRKYDGSYTELQHSYTLPQTIGHGSLIPGAEDPVYELAVNPDHPDRYYCMTKLDVEVVWKDYEPARQKMRPDSVGFILNDGNAGYSYLEVIEPDADGKWKLSGSIPMFYDGNGAICPVKVTAGNIEASPLNGYTKKIEISGGSASGYKVTVTYELTDENYATVAGDIYWNDADLSIRHADADTKLNVVQDDADAPMSGVDPNASGSDSHKTYKFGPKEAFPIWITDDTQHVYTIEPVEMENYSVTSRGYDVFYTRLVSVSGTVDWENQLRPANTQPFVALLRDGQQAGIQECEDFRYNFDGLPIAGEDGVPYQYSIEAFMPGDAFRYRVTYAQPERDPSTGNFIANATLYETRDPVSAVIPVKLMLSGPSEADNATKYDCFDFLFTCTSGDDIPAQVVHMDRSTGLTGEFLIEDLPDYSKTYTFTVTQLNNGILPWWQYDTTVATANVTVHFLNNGPVATMVLEPEKDGAIVFTNVYRGGELTAAKVLSGEGSDPNKKFDFKVELSSKVLDGTFGDMTFTDGVAFFSLKGGESKKAVLLPHGIGYSVTEADYSQDGYANDCPDGISGEIAKETPASAVITNTRVAPFVFTVNWTEKPKNDTIRLTMFDKDGNEVSMKFEKTVIGPKKWQYTSSTPVPADYYVLEEPPTGYWVTYENAARHADAKDCCYSGGTITNHKLPVTGDNSRIVLWTLTGILSLVGMAVIITRSRKKEY